jgi:hypothetical protein
MVRSSGRVATERVDRERRQALEDVAEILEGIQAVASRVEINLLDRTLCWTFASRLATVHPVAGQPRPVRAIAISIAIVSATGIAIGIKASWRREARGFDSDPDGLAA